jgi:hypothetical protein
MSVATKVVAPRRRGQAEPQALILVAATLFGAFLLGAGLAQLFFAFTDVCAHRGPHFPAIVSGGQRNRRKRLTVRRWKQEVNWPDSPPRRKHPTLIPVN